MASDMSPESPDKSPPRSAADARKALDELNADGARLAERVVTPWWYHPLLGAIVAAVIGAQALPGALSTILVAVAVIAIPLLILAYRRVYGVGVIEPAGPRSRRVLLAMMLLLIVPLAAGLTIKLTDAPVWWVALPAAVGFVAIVLIGRHYDNVLRDELAQHADDA